MKNPLFKIDYSRAKKVVSVRGLKHQMVFYERKRIKTSVNKRNYKPF